jgi:hypothetical protein
LPAGEVPSPEGAGAVVVLVEEDLEPFLCLPLPLLWWPLPWWVVFGGAEPAVSCAMTKPDVAAKKATANANTIDFFIDILLKVVQQVNSSYPN